MGLADLFSSEDRVGVKFSDFYNLIKESTKAELLTNGINCETPHAYMREMMTGKREEDAHAHTDMTIHIKPIISGIDVGSGESESPLPWEMPDMEERTLEPQYAMDENGQQEPDPWEEADKAGEVDQAESEG